MLNTDTHWLEQALDAYLKNKALQNAARKHDGYFHPSQAGKCPRYLWYEFKGYQKDPVSIFSQRAFEEGNALHNLFERIFKDAGIVYGNEGGVIESPENLFNKFKLDIPIRGTFDSIVIHPYDKSLYLVEFKSHKDVKDNGNSYSKPWNKLDSPYMDHIYQWQLYSFLTGVMKGVIFYINKNTLQYKIFEQEQDKDIIYDIIEKFEDIYKYVKENKLYPFQPNENHVWCLYKNQCQFDYLKETGDDGKQFFKRSIHITNG